MTNGLSAPDALEAAQEIERNGVAFYHQAADLVKDDDVRRVLRALSVWEDEHERTFAAFAKAWRAGNAETAEESDTTRAIAHCMQVCRERPWLCLSESPAGRLHGGESVEDVIEVAVDMELGTILFYTGIGRLFANDEDRARIDRIVTEEIQHIQMLRQGLRA